jgi:hypothetical protein
MFVSFLHRSRSCRSCGLSIFRKSTEPKALVADHVNWSSFSISCTCFNYLLLFWWGNLGTYKGEEERNLGFFVACKQATKKIGKKKINLNDREKEGTYSQVDWEGGEGTCFTKVVNSMTNWTFMNLLSFFQFWKYSHVRFT